MGAPLVRGDRLLLNNAYELVSCPINNVALVRQSPTRVNFSEVEARGRNQDPARRGVAFRVFRSIGCRRKQTVCWYGVR